MKEYYFKGIKVSNINMREVRNLISQLLRDNHKAYFCLTDVGNVMRAQNDKDLALAINHSTLSIPDGTPLAWFGKLIGQKEVERISGVNLFQNLVYQTSYKHFLLGDTEFTQTKVISKVKKSNPRAKINGYSPPFKHEFSELDHRCMHTKIEENNPDIVWVSFGGGRQEKWIHHSMAKLDHGIMIAVGAAFKFYIGDLAIPPAMVQKCGLQWFTRFKNNPKRWVTKGQLKYKILFAISFPFEVIKAKKISNQK